MICRPAGRGTPAHVLAAGLRLATGACGSRSRGGERAEGVDPGVDPNATWLPPRGWIPLITGWRGAESNRRHHDFQSCALPTELPRRGGIRLAPARHNRGPWTRPRQLARGHDSYARQAWREAYEALTAADRSTALDPPTWSCSRPRPTCSAARRSAGSSSSARTAGTSTPTNGWRRFAAPSGSA